MPSYKSAFPSKYLKANDLGGPQIVIVATTQFEAVGTGNKQEDKLVAHFAESGIKPLVLNLANSRSIAEIAGSDNYEKWAGTRIQLVVSRTEFQGKSVPCIRIQFPPKSK
jgi:hypothetical protein